MKIFKMLLLSFVFVFVFIFILGNAFAYQELLIEDRGGKPIRVIKVVLDGEHYIVSSIAKNGDTLENLIKNVGGDSGINGTFFCPADYSSCGGKTYSNFERVFLGNGVDYSLSWPNTDVRMIFGFDKEGDPLMVQNNMTEMVGLWSDLNKDKINDLFFGMSNFTVLLIQGEDVSMANQIHYDSKMYSSANRNFICSTKDGSTVYMGIVGGISIPALAPYIREKFGCHNAVALDAGASQAMVYSGNVLARSSRRIIADAFVVVDRDAYIKLTGFTPKQKGKYIPNDKYEMTDKDWKVVDVFKSVIDDLIKKEGKDFKWTAIKVIREAKGMDRFKDNPQRRAIFHELLIRLFTVDKL